MKEAAYRLWLAENLGLGISFDQLSSQLPSTFQGLFQEWEKEWMDHPVRALHERWRAQEATLNQTLALMSQAQWSQDPVQVPRAQKLSAKTFLKRYYSQNRPVLLEGLFDDWPLYRHWSIAFLASKWGNQPVRCQRRAGIQPKHLHFPERDATDMSFSEVLNDFLADHSHGAFIVANNFLLQQPGFEGLLAGIASLPEWMSGPNRRVQTHWWMGPSGGYTPWHHDSLNILLCQIWGQKKIRLVPASEWVWMKNHQGVFSEYARDTRHLSPSPLVVELVLQPGQALFLPVGWWHEVESLSPSLSLGLTHFSFPNEFEWIDPTMGIYKA